MSKVLEGLDSCALAYLDDVIIHSATFDQHLEDVRKVLSVLHRNGIKINPAKCSFAKQEIEFLGHLVSGNLVKPSPAKIKSVMEWQAPKSVSEVQSFLGLAGFYRQFVPNFAEVATPLTDLTKQKSEFQWTEK